MAKKEKAAKSGIEIGVWQGRLAASRQMFDRARREREEYDRALALNDGIQDWSAFVNVSDAIQSGVLTQQTVPLSYRYAVWLQAQTAGDPPIIKYPRTATGDETFAVTVEDLLLRVFLESGGLREWQSAIFALCGFGSTCVWYGFHAEVLTPEEAEGASEGAEETTTRALMGDPTALPGQDHGMAGTVLKGQLTDEINSVSLPEQQQIALAAGAIAQIEAGRRAAEGPRNVAVEQRQLWSRRLKVGVDVIWDHTVTDLRDARWMARRVVMTMEQAANFIGFQPHARKNLPARKFGPDDGTQYVMDIQGKPLDGPENGRFVFWEVWDKEYGTRHYICEDMAEYLEVREDYPYPDPKTGRPALPGFFPCVVSAPLKHDLVRPERTLGLPLIAPGYPIQREITRLYDFAMASVKRHSVRMYEIPDDLDDDTVAKIESGIDGTLVRRKAGVEPGDMVRPIQFTGEAYKIVELIGRLQGLWAAVMGMPLADLTSQPQADTATAELKALEAGRNQADFVIRQIEADMARGVEIQRAMLAIGLYPPERIAALLGPGHEAEIAAWQASSLDGDYITLKSASRAKAEQAVRIKQLGDALSLTTQFMDPKTGLPVFDATPIVEEILMGLDVGRPKRIEWTEEDLLMRAALMGGGGAPGGGGGGGEEKGPPSRGPGEAKRQQGPPTPASEVAAARRTGT